MKTFPFTCLLLALLNAGDAKTSADTKLPIPLFPAAPRLATTAAELQKLTESPAFPQTRDAAVQSADALLKSSPPIPAGRGDWIFYYACPDDGSSLNAESETSHRCPRCQKVYTDERTVASYRTVLHNRADDAAQQLGWAYAYTGNPEYAKAVQRILLRLADDYHTYPERRDRWGRNGILAPLGARRYGQSLDEAYGIIKLAKGYDLTRSSEVWTDAQREHVESGLFRLTADTLLWSNFDINNHQTWYNAGLMAIGSVLADQKLVQRVLTMKGGYYDQLQRSIGRDGLWYEGAMAYHNYALQAMVEIVEAGRRMGLPLDQEPKFRAMIEAPLRYAYPNGQFPAINDSDLSDIGSFKNHFLWAWRTYHDPVFAQAYAQGDPKLLAELLGPGAIPQSPIDTHSRNLEDAGLAVLRRGKEAGAVCAMLDYGPHGGVGHGHFDKLNIVLFANGREWLLDPGRLSYSHKEYKTWVKQTAAHNSVTLGGQTQAPATGRYLWLEETETYSACAAEAGDAYPDAKLTRFLLLTDSFLVDLFEVDSSKEQQIDWFAHALSNSLEPVAGAGPSSALPGNRETLGDDNGYQHLVKVRAWDPPGPSQWEFAAGEQKLKLWLTGTAREQLFASLGIGYGIDQQVPCLARRVQASKANFATVYDISGTGTGVSDVVVSPDSATTVTVKSPAGEWKIAFSKTGVTCAAPLKPAP